MPKKSRRLPGGRVRKPIARPLRPAATGAPVEEDEAQPSPVQELATVEPAGSRPAFSPVRLRPTLLNQATQTATRTGVQPAQAPRGGPVATSGRAATSTSTFARARSVPAPMRGPVVNVGPSSMDAVAATYTHLRGDLTRIAILATIMLAIIVALSFVLR